ncbi:hypothetical protein ACFWEH_38075 [Streptomyces anulatus]|uniref:hypothetical protein n=1 Tax=Streptomyces anulatus TaxID=1892 RepID=UPI00364B53B9
MYRPHHPLRRPPADGRAAPYRDKLATPGHLTKVAFLPGSGVLSGAARAETPQ